MPTEQEIRDRYLALHDDLSHRYYELHEMPKEEFDLQHGQIWQDMKQALIDAGYLSLPEPPIVFDPENPALGVEHRLTHVEQFLQTLYPPSP